MSLNSLKERALLNPSVKEEYDRLEDEFNLIDQLLSMRNSAGLTQAQVATKMGTQKSNISRLEKGNSNPNWNTLLSYADACGYELAIAAKKIQHSA